MAVKVGINGFGRIGRNIFRAALGNPSIEIVAANDITDSKTLAHLLKYDSILGNLPNQVTHTDDSICVDGKSFKVFRVKDPGQLDWASVGASIVMESTGLFTKAEEARKHIRGPVKKVIISAEFIRRISILFETLPWNSSSFWLNTSTPLFSTTDGR